MSNISILIVEDEGLVAEDLRVKLQQLGYTVAGSTGKGEEAVQMALRLRPQLILMDIQLEGPGDGIQAAEGIRAQYDVPVIYLTAHSDSATLAGAKTTGPSGYILKPFEMRDLATQIELALYKHQADRQVYEQREWLRVTLASIGDAVIATDIEGRITFMNSVAESLIGWKAGEVVHRPLSQVFRVVNEQTGQPVEDPAACVLREGRTVPLTNHSALVTREGRTVPIEDSAAPILDAAGEVLGVVLVFHDVTDKRRAEEALRASEMHHRILHETMRDGFVQVSMDGRLVEFNSVFQEMLGYPADELRALTWETLTPERWHTLESRLFREQILPRGYSDIYEKEYRCKDGKLLPVELRTVLLRDETDHPIGMWATVRDISERKAGEDALQAAEQRTSTILESVTDAFLALDRESRITFVNQAGIRMSGMRQEELIGRCLWDLLPGANALFSQYEKAVQTNMPVHFEEFCPAPLNLWVECHAYPSPQGMSAFIRDITAKKSMEETLGKERAKWETVVQNIDVGIIIADSAGTVLSMNPAALAMHGFKTTAEMFTRREAFIERFEMRSLDGKIIPPEDRPALRSLRGEYFSDMKMQVRDNLTGRHWIGSWSVSPVRNSLDEIFLLVFTVQDITERIKSEEALRQSEKKFRSLFDYNLDAVLLAVLDGSIKAANLSACKMFGYAEQEICGLRRADILDVDDPRLHNALRERQKKGAVGGCELTAIRKGGEKFPVEVDSVILPGEPLLSFVIIRDITTRKQAEASIHQMNKTLEQRVAERTEIAETRAKKLQALAVELIEAEERERRQIAHLLHDDLQQMLAAARMQLQSAPSFSKEPVLEYVAQILKESITKARRLSHELSPAVLHHSGLIAGIRWLAGRMKEQFGLNVHLQTESAPAVENTAIKLFLFRAVQELLFNAVKHAKVDQVRVALTESDRSDHHVVVTVSDQGCGFKLEEFRKGTKKPGFGLLSITERADYIGGRFEINTAPGEGSLFVLTVPLDAMDPYSPASQIPLARMDSHVNISVPPPEASSTRVLFVDDHRVMRQGLIKLVIGQPGIQVIGEAENGAQAVEQTRHLRPDMIIMDISMPEMDGIEAARRIKAELPEVRIIGLTMHDNNELREAMLQAGAEVTLSKTTSATELVKAIYGRH